MRIFAVSEHGIHGHYTIKMSLQYRMVKHYTGLVSINSRSLKRHDHSRCYKIIVIEMIETTDVGIPKR